MNGVNMKFKCYNIIAFIQSLCSTSYVRDDLRIVVQFLEAATDFTLPPAFRKRQGPTHPTVHWLPGFLPPGIKPTTLTLTSQMQLVPGLGIRGNITPHSHIPFWYGA